MKNLFALIVLYFTIAIFAESFAQYIPKDKRKKKEVPIDTTQKNPTSDKPAVDKTTQNQQKSNQIPSLGDKLAYGGSFGLGVYNNLFSFSVSPLVGYKVTDNFIAGVGATYQYQGGNDIYVTQNYYGGRVFATQRLFSPIAVWVELEGITGKFYNNKTFEEKQDLLVSPLVGLAITGSNSGSLGAYFLVLYNLNHKPDTQYYASPIILRAGFMF